MIKQLAAPPAPLRLKVIKLLPFQASILFNIILQHTLLKLGKLETFANF
jgi:hypothetical protein